MNLLHCSNAVKGRPACTWTGSMFYTICRLRLQQRWIDVWETLLPLEKDLSTNKKSDVKKLIIVPSTSRQSAKWLSRAGHLTLAHKELWCKSSVIWQVSPSYIFASQAYYSICMAVPVADILHHLKIGICLYYSGLMHDSLNFQWKYFDFALHEPLI